MANLTVLGIDPGTIRAGTVVLSENYVVRFFRTWHLHAHAQDDMLTRLVNWSGMLENLLTTYKPGIIAVENPMVSRNARTIDALARFVGVTTVAARRTGAIVLEYRPMEHRKASGGQWDSEHIVFAYRRLRKLVTFSNNARGFLKFGIADEHTVDALSLAITALREYKAA